MGDWKHCQAELQKALEIEQQARTALEEALLAEKRARQALELQLGGTVGSGIATSSPISPDSVVLDTGMDDEELLREWVHRVYARFNPGKQPNLDLLLAEFQG